MFLFNEVFKTMKALSSIHLHLHDCTVELYSGMLDFKKSLKEKVNVLLTE